MLYPPLPSCASTQELTWAYTGTRSGIAGRVLNGLCKAGEGHLSMGVRATQFASMAARIDPNGHYKITLTQGWSAFGFRDGSLILAAQMNGQLIAYPWVLRQKTRTPKKPQGIERMLDSLVNDLPFIKGPFGIKPGDENTLPWLDHDITPKLGFPSTTIRTVILTSLAPHAQALKAFDTLKIDIKGRVLMADHPKGVGLGDITVITNATKVLPVGQRDYWRSQMLAFLNSPDCDWPLPLQVGQAHGKHGHDRPDWTTKPASLYTYDITQKDVDTLSAHDRVEGERLCTLHSISTGNPLDDS